MLYLKHLIIKIKNKYINFLVNKDYNKKYFFLFPLSRRSEYKHKIWYKLGKGY